MAVKAGLYAATLSAAGGAFFLAYAARMLDEHERRVIGKAVERWLIAAVVFSVFKNSRDRGIPAEGLSGLFDSKLVHMVWHSGEDSAVVTRIAGYCWRCAKAWLARPSMGLAAAGGATAAMSFAWAVHAHGEPRGVDRGHGRTASRRRGVLDRRSWTSRPTSRARPTLVGGCCVGALRDGGARRGGSAGARGRVRAVEIPGHAAELTGSAYGRVMCVKLVFVAGLRSLGAFNKTRLTPRLEAGDAAAARALNRSIRAEMMLAGLILITTAALTTLLGPPALG